MNSPISTDTRLRWVSIASLALAAVILILYLKPVYEGLGDAVVRPIYDLSIIAIALAGSVLAFMLARSLEPGEVLRTMWQTLGLGLLLWGSGEAIWAGYDLFLGEVPFPSVADIVWLIGYIPFFVSLYLRYSTLRAAPEASRVLIIVVLSAILIGVGGYFVLLPIIQDPGENLLAKIISVLYPVGDILLALIALLVVLTLSGGALSRPWALIAAGFLVVAVADLLFYYADWNELYQPEGTINLITGLADVPYYASYILIALGLYMQGRLQRVM